MDDPSIENRGDVVLVARIGVEWAITMLGGGGNPDAWWELAGVRSRHDSAGSAADVTRLRQGNDWLGVDIETDVAPQADAWYAPIETVSNSEAGFERVYQGGALLLSWQVRIAPGDSFTARIAHRARVGRRSPAPGIRQPAACAPRADEGSWRIGWGLEAEASRGRARILEVRSGVDAERLGKDAQTRRWR